ncbi:MAG: hypothetical protein JW700_01040 [Candidatus Aenigmarchaeota archaeon]|nr:hypothetical protein [Candidatus Aenigmarchaeota archaeon]
MGLFGTFVYKNKKKKNFWLHMTMRGKSKLYFFSEDPKDALSSVPSGYVVFEDPRTGLPFLKKGSGGFLGGLFGSNRKVKKDKKPEK